MTINDWGWHVVNHDAPFGGIGNSGMGSYHGEEGFRELSHAKLYLFVIGFPDPAFPPSLWNIPTKLAIRFFLKKAIQVLNKDYKKPRNEAFYWVLNNKISNKITKIYLNIINLLSF